MKAAALVTILSIMPASASARSGVESFDLVCAIASAAQVTVSPEGSEARTYAFHIHWFYLGRLSARDDTTNWHMIVAGRLAELKTKAVMPDMYGECLTFASNKIE
jgi:hypothetical protein